MAERSSNPARPGVERDALERDALERDALERKVADLEAARVEAERALATLQRRCRLQERLLDSARRVASTLDATQVLTRICGEARQMLAAFGCAVYVLDPDHRLLMPVVSLEPPFERDVLAAPLRLDASLTGQAVLAGQAGLIVHGLTDATTWAVMRSGVALRRQVLRREMDLTMALCGINDIGDFGPDCLWSDDLGLAA